MRQWPFSFRCFSWSSRILQSTTRSHAVLAGRLICWVSHLVSLWSGVCLEILLSCLCLSINCFLQATKVDQDNCYFPCLLQQTCLILQSIEACTNGNGDWSIRQQLMKEGPRCKRSFGAVSKSKLCTTNPCRCFGRATEGLLFLPRASAVVQHDERHYGLARRSQFPDEINVNACLTMK